MMTHDCALVTALRVRFPQTFVGRDADYIEGRIMAVLERPPSDFACALHRAHCAALALGGRMIEFAPRGLA